MSFMSAELTEKQLWWNIETRNGMWSVPYDDAPELKEIDSNTGKRRSKRIRMLAKQYVECSEDGIETIELVEGYGVRSSASGYLDCTEWTVYSSLEKAQEAYQEECEENCEEEEEDDTEETAQDANPEP